MNATNTRQDSPNPQFVDALEMQMRMMMRRQALLEQLNDDTPFIKRKGMKMLGTLTLIIASMMLGATGTYAVVHQDDAPQRQLLIRKAEIYLRQAELRYEKAEADYAELKPLLEQGHISDTEVETEKLHIFNARSELQRRQLDLQETQASGHPVNDDLHAPLVDDNDYVLARLMTEVEAAEFEVMRARRLFTERERIVEQGFMTEREMESEKLGLQQMEQGLQRLMRRIELRQAFIDGKISAVEVELLGMQRQVEADLENAELQAVAARRRFEETKALHDREFVTSAELRDARADFREAESRLELAILQLEMIQEKLDGLEEK